MSVICKKCFWCAEQVGVINLWANVLLFAVKLIGGIVGRSQALLADAIHSISDIAIALLLIVSLKVSGAPPDEDHHWGHGNIEYIVSAIIGVILIFIAILIVVTGLISIYEKQYFYPGLLAIWAAVISIILNEIMFRHSICIGRQMDSPAMIANAWENRADVYSSIAALIGVIGARMGFPLLDPIAALIVAFMIAKSGIETLVSAINGITDKIVDKDFCEKVKTLILKEKVMGGISKLRARRIGQKTWLDIEINFNQEIKVSEVTKIMTRIRNRVLDKFDEVGGVHIIPRIKIG